MEQGLRRDVERNGILLLAAIGNDTAERLHLLFLQQVVPAHQQAVCWQQDFIPCVSSEKYSAGDKFRHAEIQNRLHPDERCGMRDSKSIAGLF